MRPFLDKFGLVGSAGQSPVAFPCSFAVSLPVTASILQTGGGVTSAPGTPDLLAASDSGASATDNVTSDTTPAFRVGLPVEAIAGDTVRVYRAGSTEIGSAALDAGDVVAGFVDVMAAVLSVGGHSITARVENGAGLSPASAGLAITVDTAAPDAPTAIIVAPADQGSGTLQTDDTQPTFRISLPANAVAGDVATLEIDTVDDAAATLIAGDIANGYVDIQSASVLADDTFYDISAFITDAAGNQGVSSAAVEVEVGDASGDAIPAVVYDGVQGYMLHTGGPAGAADGAALTVVWAGRFNSDGSAMTLLDIPGSVPVKLTRNADNTISFVGGTAGAVFSNVTPAVAASLGFLIVLASGNGTSSTLKVVHAAGTITGVNTAGSAADLDLTADWYLGADGGAAEFLDADTAMWWIDGQFLDFANANAIEQFWDTTADTLRDPGADGSNPLDGASSPLVSHKSPAASHTTNAGTGGNADTAGSFTDGTSPGSYAGDFVPAASIAIAVTATPSNGANTTNYTFTAQDIGAEAADRYLMVISNASVASSAGGLNISSFTIDGNTVSPIVSVQGSDGNARTRTAIFLHAMPTGTEADFFIQYNATAANGSLIICRVTGIDPTPHDSDSATGAALGKEITIPNHGLAVVAATAPAATTTTFTDITEQVDSMVETLTRALGFDIFVTGGNVTLTPAFGTTSARDSAVFVSFAPA